MDLLEVSEYLLSAHERIYQLLRELVDSGRLPQSLLFSGPQGTGKSFAAVAVASWLNCNCGDDGRCSSCSKISRLEHPDMQLIFPVPHGDWRKSLAAVIEAKREDFIQGGSVLKGSIGIDMIRHLIETTSKQPFEGRWTVAVLFDAHAMTVEAQNAFLKVLEEPPSSTVFILVTEFPDRLLPTITSRCQAVRFGYLDDDAVAEFLVRFFSVGKGEARRRAVLAMGDVERAVRMGDEDFERYSRKAASIIRAVVSRKSVDILAQAEDLAFGMSREEVLEVCREVTALVRTVLRGLDRGYNEVEQGILGDMLGAEVEKRLREEDLPLWIDKITAASTSIARNADVELTLAQLFLDLAGKWY